MLVNLSDVLTQQGKTLQTEFEYEPDRFSGSMGEFVITEKSPVRIQAKNTGEGKAYFEGSLDLTFAAQCDRCLKEVPVRLDLRIETVLTAPDTVTEEEDTRQFMDGYKLDLDALIRNEIVVNWPLKILCKEDCRGICPVCGQDLNEKDCGCDTFVPDPRMSVLKDIFAGNKEVE